MSMVDKVIEAAGDRKQLAEALGVTRQAVHNWVMRGCVPPDKAIRIERLFGVPATSLVSPQTRELLASLQRVQ